MALPSKEDSARNTGNMHKKLGEIWRCVFLICEQADRQKQTDKQIYRQADRNTLPTYWRRRSEVKID